MSPLVETQEPPVPAFTRGTGWLPDSDLTPLGAPPERLGSEPSEHILLFTNPQGFQRKVEDQFMSNSCTGQVAGEFSEYFRALKTGRWAEFSRTFPYYKGRQRRGWERVDGGALIRDVFSSMAVDGNCLDVMHPMLDDAGNLNVFAAPSERAIQQARRHRLVGVRPVAREDVLPTIASGRPVAFGLYSTKALIFGTTARISGEILAPASGATLDVAHALMLAGYDKTKRKLYGPNSWGERTWGSGHIFKAGWYEASMDYLEDERLTSDFWTADSIEVPDVV